MWLTGSTGIRFFFFVWEAHESMAVAPAGEKIRPVEWGAKDVHDSMTFELKK